MQHQAVRYFLHGHPLSATSWKEKGTINLAAVMRVIKTKVHMSRFGMTQMTSEGPRLAKKPTGFRANSVRRLVRDQCQCMVRRNDKISHALEEYFQRNANNSIMLQKQRTQKMAMSLRTNDVSEIYSPPRVVRFAK